MLREEGTKPCEGQLDSKQANLWFGICFTEY
jgi:hypothetical protein